MTQDKMTYLADYQPPAFHIDSIDLSIHLDPEATQVVNTMKINRLATADPKSPLVLDGEALKLKQVVVNDTTLQTDEYTLNDKQLIIPSLPATATVTIMTETAPLHNTTLEGLYMSNGRFFTQCESQGFRRITYYMDRPDVLAKFTTTVHGDREAYPYCLANGNLIDQGLNTDTNQHWFTWQNPYPMPSYLFACVAGDFFVLNDEFTTASGKPVQLKLFVEPRNANKCEHALAALKAAMRWDEDNYGREYDLDNYMICAVDDFNSGAMENKGLNIFNSECVLANEESATDFDFELIEAVVGHEYFHNWTGNRVTCRDWFQLCLKEGLTVFREQQFMETMALPVQQRIADVRMLRTRQFPEDAGPMAHPVRPDRYQQIRNFYTATVYNKGAEVYRMLWNLLGKDKFRHAMDKYFETYDGTAATIELYVENMQAATGKDLSQFHLWYNQAGTPQVTVTADYNADQQSLALTITQQTPATPGQPDKQPMQFPFALGLLDNQGNDLPLNCTDPDALATDGVLEIKQARQTFTFTDIPERPHLSLLRGFSAPVKVEYDYSPEELLFLWRYDTDDFNRWDAGQRYLTQMILLSDDVVVFDDCIEVITALLQDNSLNPALVAELISLPSESYLTECKTPVDIDAIINKRDAVKAGIGKACQALFKQAYQDHASGKVTETVSARHHRQLQNLCLDYLLTVPSVDNIALCCQQYDSATNMTNRISALKVLSHIDCPERRQKLEQFYQTYQDDPIVVNKWLSIQAQSTLPTTLAEVQQLQSHAAYSIKNPNKVRALVGALCVHNLRHFHAADGSGYAYLADTVLQLNDLNPQVGARLLTPLSQWAKMDKARAELMKGQLRRLQQYAKLSSDVEEVVTKALA